MSMHVSPTARSFFLSNFYFMYIVPLVEFMYLVFTQGDSYCRRLGSLLLCLLSRLSSTN